MAKPVVATTFKRYLQDGTIDGDDDSFVLALSNDEITSADSVLGDISLISEENGYEAIELGFSIESDGGTGFRVVNDDDESWTAVGGSFGPFRRVVVYDDTPTSPTDPLVQHWDVGSEVTVTAGNSFALDLDANFTIWTLDDAAA